MDISDLGVREFRVHDLMQNPAFPP